MRNSGSVTGRCQAALALAAVAAMASACSGSSGSAASVATSTTTPATPAPSIEDPTVALDAAVQTAAPVSQVVQAATVESTGIPGLDSPDRFCAAWSRFAGSFQVVAVTAAFGSGGPDAVAALEVVAAPVATDAYAEMMAAWPAELDAERELVADQVLGPFQRRLADALVALEAIADDPAVIDTVRVAWLATLAARDPASPEVTVDLGAAEWATVDAAVQSYLGVRAPFSEDPSLVNDVVTPLTDAFLAATCPDQGLLAGQDLVEG